MIRFLIRMVIAVVANAVGLLVAAALLDGMHVNAGSFVVAVIIFTVAIPSLIWVFLSAMFLVFAVPAVVLDGHGPVDSIGVSFRMVARHFWGVFGRFFVFFLILFVCVMVAAIPAMILAAGGSLLARAGTIFRIGAILWTSLITAFTFPFWVASLILQYRALAPAGGEETVADAAATGPVGSLAPRPASGEQPTPYIFE